MKRSVSRTLSLLLPWLVGLVVLAITAALALHEQRTLQQTLRASFELGLRQATSRVEQRIASYELVLRGTQGLFRASEHITDASFASYADALLAGADFAGLQAIGHVAAPDGPQGRALLRLVAPQVSQNQQVLGHDMRADPVRWAALQQSRDSGGIVITRRVRLLSDPVSGPENGFLMVLPLYAPGQALTTPQDRRQHHRGWVFAAFRMSDLMSSLYGEGMPGLEVRIYDGVQLDDAALMYRSGPAGAPGRPPRFEAQEYIGFAGHTWTLGVRTLPDFEALHNLDSPRIVAVAGTSLGLVLALLTRALVGGRERAHALAQRMTRELRDSEERYRRIVETADEGIWMCDAALRTSFVNPKARQMLGHPAEQLQAQPLTHWLDEPSRAVVQAALQRRAAAGPEQHEVRFQRADGSQLWASLALTPIVDAGGRFAGTLAMFTDITQAREAEARRALLEAQLRESQKMEAIGTLAGGIAHDFNNILAAILGNATLAREMLPPGHPAGTHLAQIGHAGAHARSLVQQIVTFSRRQPLARVAQPLGPLVEATIGLLRATLPAGVELQATACDEPVWARVDANQFQQVLMNLCTNAWHALQGGIGRVTVGLASEPAQDGAANGRRAHLWVSDTGCGMDEATCVRIFEPFFTTKPVGQGTGLGLSVVHGIVAAHEGSITVHSRPGEGTRFDLYFPQVAPESATGPAQQANAATEPVLSGNGERLLYVDDDPVMVALAEALLVRAGYTVRCFDDARAALSAVRAEPEAFDLVITDYNMPELSGLDVVAGVHAARPGLPVIISSGYLSEDIRAAARRAGVQHLLQKEYTIEQLLPLVRRVLAAAAAQRDATDQPAPH
ncbi:MAG: CHASE domain-containing protein [Burkholderiales bacterium]|nr:CHASE domain-containing protein [Burkholderiales bacterium]